MLETSLICFVKVDEISLFLFLCTYISMYNTNISKICFSLESFVRIIKTRYDKRSHKVFTNESKKQDTIGGRMMKKKILYGNLLWYCT